jgi:nitrite reductase/ring-hydroxylating ferredoxin subunit
MLGLASILSSGCFAAFVAARQSHDLDVTCRGYNLERITILQNERNSGLKASTMCEASTPDSTGTSPCGTTRRQVLKGSIGTGILLSLPVVPALAAGADQWTVAGKTDDFVKDTPKKVVLQGFTFYVTRTSDTDLTTVYAKCTHHGCTVAWDPNAKQLACPCHGAAFGTDGVNIHGTRHNPDEKLPKLTNMPTRQKDGNVEINLAPQS